MYTDNLKPKKEEKKQEKLNAVYNLFIYLVFFLTQIREQKPMENMFTVQSHHIRETTEEKEKRNYNN